MRRACGIGAQPRVTRAFGGLTRAPRRSHSSLLPQEPPVAAKSAGSALVDALLDAMLGRRQRDTSVSVNATSWSHWTTTARVSVGIGVVLACAGTAAPSAALAGGNQLRSHRHETTISVDERVTARELAAVVGQVQKACVTVDRVRFKVRTRTDTFTTLFDCAALPADSTAEITAQLVATAGKYRRAATKADRVIAVQQALPPTPGLTYERDRLLWSFAASDPATCQRAAHPNAIREAMAAAARANNETPEHWTLIEAVMLSGACPSQLPVLFRNVTVTGQPQAAASVALLLTQHAPRPSRA